MTWRMIRLLAEAGLIASVGVAALWILSGEARRVTYEKDESAYLERSRYFGYLFLERDITRSEWGDNKRTHTQPMLTNYVIGGWLWARGRDLNTLPRNYDHSKNDRQNILEGRVPDAQLLDETRMPMLAISSAAVALLYLVGRLLGGPLAGLTTAAIVLASPLSPRLVPARNDSPLVFFIVLALLLGVLGARRGRCGGLPAGWAIALGTALGLAFGTKLTGVFGLVATLGWGMAQVVLAALHPQSRLPGKRLARAWAAGRGWLLALAVALGVFVLSNPHLYRDPIRHTRHLFLERYERMLEQQLESPKEAVYAPLDRVGQVLDGSLLRGTWGGRRGLPLEAVLAVVGTAVLLVRTWRDWRQTGLLPADGLVLLTAFVYFAGVSAGLLRMTDKYFVPTHVLGALIGGLAVSAIAPRLPVVGGVFRRRAPLGRTISLAGQTSGG